MPETVFLIIGLILGFVFGWYWVERRLQEAIAADKAAFDTRLQQSMAEIQSANEDNRELRDKLVELQLAHQECAPAQARLQLRIDELERSHAEAATTHPGPMEIGSEDARERAPADLAKIAELEWQLAQERERRQVLRGEFEKIEQQLARSGLGAVQLGGGSLALHEASAPFTPAAAQTSLVESDNTQPPADALGLFQLADGVVPDDLKRIKGIGPVLERKLHALGVKTFAQIAAFSAEDIARVDAVLNFKGRIEREDWIGQARELGSSRLPS